MMQIIVCALVVIVSILEHRSDCATHCNADGPISHELHASTDALYGITFRIKRTDTSYVVNHIEQWLSRNVPMIHGCLVAIHRVEEEPWSAWVTYRFDVMVPYYNIDVLAEMVHTLTQVTAAGVASQGVVYFQGFTRVSTNR